MGGLKPWSWLGGIAIAVVLAVLSAGLGGYAAAIPVLAGDRVFVPDDFFEHQPSGATSFIPANIIGEIRVKQNLHHMAAEDRFVPDSGTIRTLPFMAPHYLAVPVLGASEDQMLTYGQRARVILRCLNTLAEIDVLRGPSEGWFLNVIRVPLDWCDGPAQLIGTSPTPAMSVGVGTPLRVDVWVWLLSGRLGVLVCAGLAAALFLAMTWPIMALARFSLWQRLAALVLYQSVAGAALFLFVWFVGAGAAAKALALLFAALPVMGLGWFRTQGGGRVDKAVSRQFLTGFAAALTILVLPYLLLPLENGFWFPSYAFFPASWSGDSLLAIMTAKSILAQGAVHPDFLGPWSIADRGIVQSGTMLLLYALPELGGALVQSPYGIATAHIWGGLLQGLVIPVGVVFVCSLLKTRFTPQMLAIALASTPFLMMNTFYIWPKLSAALLVLVGVFALWRALRTGAAPPLCLAVAAFVLAEMNHSSSLICGLMVAAYLAVTLISGFHSRAEWRGLTRSALLPGLAVAAACVAVRYAAAQIDDKTSWPLLFLLTGEGRYGLDGSATMAAISAFYRTLTFDAYWAMIRQGIDSLIWTHHDYFMRNGQGSSALATIRAHEFFSLLPALGPGLLLALPFARTPPPGSPRQADLHQAVTMVGTAGAIGLSAYMMLFFLTKMTIHLPYGMVLGVVLSLFVRLGNGRHLLPFVALQVVNLVVVWYWGAAYTWFYDVVPL